MGAGTHPLCQNEVMADVPASEKYILGSSNLPLKVVALFHEPVHSAEVHAWCDIRRG